MSWKGRVVEGLSALGVPRLVRLLPSQNLLIFNYHRVSVPGGATAFDDEVFGPDADAFEAQMRWLKKNTDVLSEADLLEVCSEKRRPRGVCSAVTFDDGYRDNFDVAYPILKAAGVPAMFFVPTEAISTGRLSWWDHIAYLVKASAKGEFSFRDRTYRAGPRERATCAELLRLWRSSGGRGTETFVAELAAATGAALPTAEQERGELMTWDHIRAAAAGGIGIGSHTVRHRILSHIPLEDQRRELADSKAALERELGRPIVSLAYPVGQYEHFNVETKRLAEECGYRMAFSFLTGTASRGRLDRFDIPRTCVPETLDRLDAGCAFPGLFFPNRSALAAPAPFSAARAGL
jgi:peptidoglycan/xylan/chitin deacetylase (PgdA/CDA1 family)